MSLMERVLVVYGDPPKMSLIDERGRKISRSFELSGSNQLSFQHALHRALRAFLGSHADLENAEFVRLKDAAVFNYVVKSANFTHVIYYGHAISDLNILLPTTGVNLAPSRIASSLAGTTVTHFDILGCNGSSIAAELSLLAPKVRIGYLRGKREDNVEVDPSTLRVRSLVIDPQPILHFGDRK